MYRCPSIVIFVVLILACFVGFSAEFYTQEKLESNINRAGENADAIREALGQIEDEELLEAFSFLLAYMPAVDIVAVDPIEYLKEVELALRLRDELPWGRDCSKEIFFNFVLPHRMSQEPLQYWRGFLFAEFTELLDTVYTAYDAAVAINEWCGERVYFRQTQRQDQGVFETLKSGFGRCEEMAIVYVSACRAAGIPARSAWTPYWAHSDNNHAWVEVFVNGEWHYTGGCEPRPSLNDAWFNESVKYAPLVLSPCYGKPLTEDNIYKEHDDFSIAYSTANYGLTPGFIEVITPAESLSVNVSIYNWGGFRRILHHYTDSLGKAIFEMNAGDYFISAGDSATYIDAIVNVKAGETTTIDLEPVDIQFTEKRFDLKYR